MLVGSGAEREIAYVYINANPAIIGINTSTTEHGLKHHRISYLNDI